ncbi:MAG: succinate dehydrogenase, hydrophobic membrane anchor protein [Betaproteobacteria bacterium]|nr:succinate dehydrogenase, hydrophobic membrane anchor protein [Betaproteobacteria bacterium]
MVKRIVVGAHYGLRDWLVQRITALIMALYTLLAVLVVLIEHPQGASAWRGLLQVPVVRIATFVFVLSLCWHAWVGIRDILMDYVKPVGWRLFGEVAVILVLLSEVLWAAEILWG